MHDVLVQEYKIKILKYMDEVGKLDNCDRKRLYKVIKNCTKCVLRNCAKINLLFWQYMV